MNEYDGRMFWNRIDKELDERGLNLTQMCEEAGVSYKNVSMQRTRHSIPKIDQLLCLADYLDRSVEYLVRGQGPDRSTPSKRAMAVAYAFDNAPDIDKDYIEQRILHIVPQGKNTAISI